LRTPDRAAEVLRHGRFLTGAWDEQLDLKDSVGLRRISSATPCAPPSLF
jgi:hypothetical protein